MTMTAAGGGGRFLVLILAVALGVAACGSSSPPPPEPADRELASGRHLARFAFTRGDPDQAVLLYDRTLDRAYARDDVEAIAEVGYESALALLRAGRPAEAATRARRIREELTRRGERPFPELLLSEAVASYAAGNPVAADVMADATIREVGVVRTDDGDVADASVAAVARAAWVRGMVAADRRDRAGVAQAVANIGEPQALPLQADRAELTGRLRLIDNDAVGALAAFDATADARREAGDYAGLARALGFAGAAAEAAGRPEIAADRYLRAGRSAAQSRLENEAETWLKRAEALAARTGRSDVAEAAREQLLQIRNDRRHRSGGVHGEG